MLYRSTTTLCARAFLPLLCVCTFHLACSGLVVLGEVKLPSWCLHPLLPACLVNWGGGRNVISYTTLGVQGVSIKSLVPWRRTSTNALRAQVCTGPHRSQWPSSTVAQTWGETGLMSVFIHYPLYSTVWQGIPGSSFAAAGGAGGDGMSFLCSLRYLAASISAWAWHSQEMEREGGGGEGKKRGCGELSLAWSVGEDTYV